SAPPGAAGDGRRQLQRPDGAPRVPPDRPRPTGQRGPDGPDRSDRRTTRDQRDPRLSPYRAAPAGVPAAQRLRWALGERRIASPRRGSDVLRDPRVPDGRPAAASSLADVGAAGT